MSTSPPDLPCWEEERSQNVTHLWFSNLFDTVQLYESITVTIDCDGGTATLWKWRGFREAASRTECRLSESGYSNDNYEAGAALSRAFAERCALRWLYKRAQGRNAMAMESMARTSTMIAARNSHCAGSKAQDEQQ